MTKWDTYQEQVITAPEDFRILVTAPPGSGKTDVACARIAYLIENSNVDPGNILLVSFARTTISSLRDRIKKISGGDNSRVLGVRISTIDSQAWKILRGFQEDLNFQDLLKGYDDNIEKSLILLSNPTEELLSFLKSFKHIVIDEAQDIIGERAKLIVSIINHLSEKTGITVLGDLAQAIYDFTVECEEVTQNHEHNLIEIISAGKELVNGDWFIDIELEQNYRTEDLELLGHQREIRKLLTSELRKDEYQKIYEILKSIKHNKCTEIAEERRKFILFRKRVEVLVKASYMYQEKKPHKIRVGSMPTIIEPSIGILFYDFDNYRLDINCLKTIYEHKLAQFQNSSPLVNLDINLLYDKMMNLSQDRSGRYVDMVSFRRSLYHPPPEFCCREIGTAGDTLSTIHAAKGMEAEHVTLILPPFNNERDFAFNEEGRILYVGATRAIQVLNIETASYLSSSKLPSNRIYRFTKNGVQIELGLQGDFAPLSTIHIGSLLKDSTRVDELQEKLIENCNEFKYINAERESGQRKYRTFIALKKGDVDYCYYLGDLSDDFYSDAKAICNKKISGISVVDKKIRSIGFYGIGTGVVRMDELGEYNQIPIKYQKSGFYIYPLLRGFCMLSPRKWEPRN